MDFFANQESSRKATRNLTTLYVIATAATAVGFGAVCGKTSQWFGCPIHQEIGLLSAAAVLITILSATIHKALQWKKRGGEALASEIGGKRLVGTQTDTNILKLLNTVEEMAISSGIPAPVVYLLENESCINSFVVGQEPSDAILYVTRGAIDDLSRDELQGMVAHEYGHIANGDLAITARVISLVHGYLAIPHLLIKIICPKTSSSGTRDTHGCNCLPLILFSGVFLVSGAGLIAVILISSLITRQRDYLADASAIQFTRHPLGLASTLKKISTQEKSDIEQDLPFGCTMFVFGAETDCVVKSHLSPEERLQKVYPEWVSDLAPERTVASQSSAPAAQTTPPPLPQTGHAPPLEMPAPTIATHHGLPPVWIEATRDTVNAGTLILALLLSTDEKWTEAQMAEISRIDPSMPDRVSEVATAIASLPSASKLALANLSIPALREIGKDDYIRFRSLAERLIASDGRVDLFELAVSKIFTHSLDGYYKTGASKSIKYHRVDQIKQEASLLISLLASRTAGGTLEVDTSLFSTGDSHFQQLCHGELVSMPVHETTTQDISDAIDKIELASPKLKSAIFASCQKTLQADPQSHNNKAELIYALAGAIDCPIALGLAG